MDEVSDVARDELATAAVGSPSLVSATPEPEIGAVPSSSEFVGEGSMGGSLDGSVDAELASTEPPSCASGSKVTSMN